MSNPPLPDAWARRELSACIICNRANHYPILATIFSSASYLGNGLLWYVLMLTLLISQGSAAVPLVLTMGAVGIASTILYKLLKNSTMRPRPCAVTAALLRTVEPLDHFSFPSGHTLHAVAFTTLVVSHHPQLGWFLIPFTVIVAASRLVLGLHYPSDVLVGASIGAGAATLGIITLNTLGV